MSLSVENSLSISPIATPHSWYALKVRAGGEFKPKLALEQKGFDIYLPTYVDCRKYSDRIRKVDAALFTGYLFCRFDAQHRLPILTTPGVDSIIGVGGVPRAIEDSEIEAIRNLVESGASPQPWPYLREGDPVRIEFGAFSGVTGFLVKTRGVDRLVLSIHMLQRSISIEIDRAWVRPVQKT
jgi:transcription antitermination factor NusG